MKDSLLLPNQIFEDYISAYKDYKDYKDYKKMMSHEPIVMLRILCNKVALLKIFSSIIRIILS